MIKILIVEDQKILLDGLANSLNAIEDFSIVGKLTDIADSIEFLKKNKVDLLLTDIRTENGNNSLNYIGDIKKDHPGISIIVMTSLPEISFAEKAKENGADSFIYKNISLDEMVSIIKSTSSGYNVFPENTKKSVSGFSTLSKQELRVLRLYCEGYDRAEIAEVLSISENSVKFHIRNMLEKTQFASMSRLAIYAVSNNLIILD